MLMACPIQGHPPNPLAFHPAGCFNSIVCVWQNGPPCYPDSIHMDSSYPITPLATPPNSTIQVPGSKSMTNRALVLAALAEPHDQINASILDNVLRAEDTEVMVDSLQRLGIAIETRWPDNRLIIPCTPIANWKDSVDFFCGNSGTTIRFLTALLALGHGRYRLDGVARMRQRPIDDLLESLRGLGIDAKSELGNGCPPVLLHARGISGGATSVRGDISSQFLSALLLAAPHAQGPLTIEVDGDLVSVPYVKMTMAMMRDWGIFVEANRTRQQGYRSFTVAAPMSYRARTYSIEPDASSASYFWAAAAITGGTVTIPGLEQSCQGDIAFRDCLLQMGCTSDSNGMVRGGKLTGIDVDMNGISDTVMTLAVVALFANGPTIIRNVAHIRHKETDRLAALAAELRKVGGQIEEYPDGLKITPGSLKEATLSTYNDHRMAMSLALIGLRIPGIRIENPGCVAKTYPGFWQDLENLRQ